MINITISQNKEEGNLKNTKKSKMEDSADPV
jgi:hypothetical protein